MPRVTLENDDEKTTRIYYGGNGGTDQKNIEDMLPNCRILLSFYHIRFRVNDSNRRAERLVADARRKKK